MQIPPLGTVILTSISSTLPLPWPLKNQKCQITCIDLCVEGEFWFDTEWSPPDSAENQLCLNQTLISAFSNTAIQLCPLKKNLTAYKP